MFTEPANITITANAADADGTIASVAFYQNGTLITTVTAAPYVITWTGVPAGSYSLTAVATDDAGATATSAAVAVTVGPHVAQMYFVHPDHLGTPRAVSDASGTPVWRWDQTEPFGDSVADGNPSGLGTFEFNPRFPGQYADRETSLSYNVRRDYDPRTARYAESDPIGLMGGLNTYTYVVANPLMFSDPTGLLGFGGGGSATSGKVVPRPITPIVPETTCKGTWEPLDELEGPGIIGFFVCKCRWTCKTCEGGYPGIVVDNFGTPVAPYGTPDAEPGEKKPGGGRGPTKIRPGKPTGCACARPGGEIPCDTCPKK